MMHSMLDRRDFLRLGLAGVSVAGTYPLFLGKTAAAARQDGDPDDDRILVVLQLSGGNDGLSTVVPYADPAYGRARERLRVAEGDVLRIDGRVGLHPNWKDLKKVFDDGRMAIIQGVSYPNPTRSHFQAMDIWHAGDRDMVREGTGWLGRAVDSTCGNKPDPLLAVNLGKAVPRALIGKVSQPASFGGGGGFGARGKRDRDGDAGDDASPEMKASRPLGQIDFLQRVAIDGRRSAAVIQKATQSYRPSADYPAGNRLAADLRAVAGLIAGKLPTRVYYVSLGGFDTHANQRGTHDNLMRVVSTGVSAFLADLSAQGLLDRVLVLAFSEFGRRVKENASGGTDHGVAAPMFLIGGKVAGGLHGEHPSLTELAGGDLAMKVDFRQVYATVLDGWLGIDSGKILGAKRDPLPLLQGKRGRVRAF